MKKLALYPKGLNNPIDNTQGVACPEDCTKCSLGEGGAGASAYAIGDPDGVLMVGESPLGAEVRSWAPPFSLGAGAMLLKMVKGILGSKHLAADYALKCPMSGKLKEEHLNACRPHLAKTIELVQPELIIAFGPIASGVLSGRAIHSTKTTDAVDWLEDGTPIYYFPRVQEITRNKFRRREFKRRLRAIVEGEVEPAFPPVHEKFRLVETVEETAAACEELRQAEWFAYDTETEGIMWTNYFQINTLSACAAGSRSPFVWDRVALQDEEHCKLLAQLMQDANAKKVGHNLKFDLHAVSNHFGITPQGSYYCTLLASRLIDAECDGSLEALAEKVGMGGHKLEAKEALGAARVPVRNIQSGRVMPDLNNPMERQILHYATRKPDSWAYGYMPEFIRNRYCALDTLATTLLAEKFMAEMPEAQKKHWDNLVSKTTEAVRQVEEWGIQADVAHLKDYSAFLARGMAKKEQHIDSHIKVFGDEARAAFQRALPDGYNPGSAKQTASLLFDVLNLEPQKLTPGGAPSVDKEALETLARTRGQGFHLIEAILDWRKLAKQKGTYAEGMRAHIRNDDRIHPSLRIAGTATGRLSCSEPNLQNVPRAKGSAEARMARNVFKARPGYVLMDADYSQLELRVAAGLSGDPKMKAIFAEGVDYHRRTAELISKQAWGISPDQVTDVHRSAAKTVNFAVLYGQGINRMAATIGCAPYTASAIQRALFGEFRDLESWISDRLKHAIEQGDTWTMWEGAPARRRPLFGIGEPEGKQSGSAERCAWNTPIQGTASDYCLAALVDCVQWLKEDCVPAKLVLTVHDSLVFEVAEEAVEEVAEGVRHIMESRTCGGVKLEADIATGTSWGEMEEYLTDEQIVFRAIDKMNQLA